MCLRNPVLSSFFALLLAIPLSLASPLPPQTYADTSPCSQIASSLKPVPNTPPGSTVKGQVPAQLAWECLHSIPLNATGALQLVDSIKPYLSFQSTVGALKNPPAEYAEKLFGPVDLYGGLDDISAKIKAGAYNGEYEFGLELYTLFQKVHDGHLFYAPDSVNKLFSWQRPLPLVAVSEDGEVIPAIFAYSDILLASQDMSFAPSPVEEIDNYDYEEYLEKLSTIGSLQDRDALWNTLFFSLPQTSLGPNGLGNGVFGGGGRGRIIYPGPNTKILFENGTTVIVDNYALVKTDFTGIQTGQDVYDKFFRVDQDMTVDLFALKPGEKYENDPRYPKGDSEASITAALPAPGYPPPVARSLSNEIGGYYLDEAGYEDVAVLSMPSFVGTGGQDDFQSVARTFLGKAAAAGKKKLIIDVSANGGGTIWLGYEIFLNLFPKIDPYGGNRFRAHQTWDELGKLISNITAVYNRTMSLPELEREYVSSPMNYRSDLQENGKPFESWAQKYGPNQYGNDLYTTTQRWNLDDPLQSDYSGLTAVTTRGLPALDLPFKAEDMVIVYDGYCASTCTIFSEFMRRQAGVETIAMGGRLNENIIQAVGGTKGTNNWSWIYIMSYVMSAFQIADKALKDSWIGTEISTFNSYLPYHRTSSSPGLNMRDGVRQGDASKTALQFVVEPADCRLYYTADMTINIAKMWEAVADAKWLGKKACVAGHLAGSKASKREKRAKHAKQSKSAKVSAVQSSAVSDLERSSHMWTEYHHDKSADGIIIP